MDDLGKVKIGTKALAIVFFPQLFAPEAHTAYCKSSLCFQEGLGIDLCTFY